MLAHLGGTGRAVQADHVDAERLQRGQRGTDLGAEQHGAGRLERHRTQQREVESECLHGAAGAQQGGLGLQQVLGGLDDQGVGAARDQSLRVRLESVAQRAVGDVAEGRQLGTGADGAEDPAPAAVAGRVVVGDLTGQPRSRLGEFVHTVGDVVLGHGRVVRSEGVGLDTVHADVEIGLVDRTDDVRPGEVQDLVAAFEVLEVLQRRILRLQHRAHRAVRHHHTGGEGLTQCVDAGPVLGELGRRGRVRQRSHEGAPWSATAVGFALLMERARRQGSPERRPRVSGVQGTDGRGGGGRGVKNGRDILRPPVSESPSANGSVRHCRTAAT